jgi:hypothetical protein
MAFKPFSWIKRIIGGLEKRHPAMIAWEKQFIDDAGSLALSLALAAGKDFLAGKTVPEIAADIIAQAIKLGVPMAKDLALNAAQTIRNQNYQEAKVALAKAVTSPTGM